MCVCRPLGCVFSALPGSGLPGPWVQEGSGQAVQLALQGPGVSCDVHGLKYVLFKSVISFPIAKKLPPCSFNTAQCKILNIFHAYKMISEQEREILLSLK